MHPSFILPAALISTLSFSTLGIVSASVAAEKRAACNHDNVLRALSQNAQQASPFCQTYANIPITTTVEPVGTRTPSIIPYTETIFYISYSGSLTFSSTPLPTYLSGVATSRVSSACSCFIPQASRTSTAYLGPYGTVTQTTSTTTTTFSPAINLCTPAATAFPGVYANEGGNGPAPFMEFIPNVTSADACCNQAYANPFYRNAIIWMFDPTLDPSVACSVYESAEFSYLHDCPDGLQSDVLYANPQVYPNKVAGLGRCASEIYYVEGPAPNSG
ncbi:hypothetical protein MMC12_000172 [Toensbergia leucococca]|nr:hypothetical protein [Toensbergia leucococca]